MKEGAELDLGIMPEESKGGCCEPSPCLTSKDESKKPCYPSLCFRDKHAALFVENYGQPSVGDEYEVTLRLRVNGTSDRKWDKSIEFDVLSVIGDFVEEEGSDKEEEGEMEMGEEKEKKTVSVRKISKKSE